MGSTTGGADASAPDAGPHRPGALVSSDAGCVVWITGLAGAGKTTLGREVRRRLKERHDAVVMLDGDRFREVMGGDLKYDLADRLANAMRICRTAALLSEQGIDVVVTTISLFHECHRWNRAHLPRFLEVLIEVDPATLKTRNQKGLHDAGAQHVMGLDQTPEFPEAPDLVIRNDAGGDPIDVSARKIVERMGQL